MEIVMVPIGEIKEAEYNPRLMTEKQVADLSASIDEFGLVDPLVLNRYADRMNILVGGHMRLKIARSKGYTEMPCVYVNLPLEKEKRLNLRLNKNNGEWSWDMLANNFDIETLIDVGFDKSELNFFDMEDDGSGGAGDPSKIIEPQSKLGDLYELGDHRIFVGDCTIKENVEKLMGGKKADISFTSPPYNVGHNLGYDSDSKYENSDDDLDKYRELLVDSTRLSMHHATDSFVNLQILANNKKDIALFLAELANEFKDIFFWKKSQVAPAMAMNVANSQVENIFLFQEEDVGWIEPIALFGYKNNRKWGNKPFRGTFSNLIETKSASTENEHADIHNATFPMALPMKFLEKGYMIGSSVLDLFIGLGTTMVVCQKMKMKCYGMEVDERYADLCVNRWCKMTGITKIKKNGEDYEWQLVT